MSTRGISNIREQWNIPENVHREVRKDLFDQLEFRHGRDLSQLYEVFDGDVPTEYEPEVEVGAYMDVLNSLDGRTWHEREVDVLTQKYEDILETSEYDMMIRDLDLNHSKGNYRASNASASKKSLFAELGLPITDIDFAMVSFTDDEVLIDFWDIKTRKKDLSTSDLGDKIDSVAEEVSVNGLEVKPERNTIFSEEVGLELDDMGVETLPNRYSGDYRFANDFRPETNGEALDLFVNSFLGYGLVDELEEISRR